MVRFARVRIRVGEIRAEEDCASEIRAGELDIQDVALCVSAPDHTDGRLNVGPYRSFLKPVDLDLEGGHCSWECSRMNAASTSITVGWSLAESRAIRSRA